MRNQGSSRFVVSQIGRAASDARHRSVRRSPLAIGTVAFSLALLTGCSSTKKKEEPTQSVEQPVWAPGWVNVGGWTSGVSMSVEGDTLHAWTRGDDANLWRVA